MIAAWLSSALALSALAVEAPALPELAVSRSAPGWSKQGRSLVLYDAEGSLSFEIGLLREETGSVTREVSGGVAPNGEAAWTLERRLTWNPSRGRLLESRRMLKIHGSTGQTLWSDDAADWPEKGEPVAFSDDSKVVLIARHLGESWTVEARDWAGSSKLKAGPFPRLVSVALAPGGRYAVARWGVPDKSDTHSFFDLWTKARKDIETSDLTLGLARLGDDGVVRSGRRDVFAFITAPSTTTEGARK
ncbi:MAG: hypothetical protein HY403_09750 [Elusimicrobia bacterium]|nr:hypothetical protein [Elusimicrobiota bacterium]